MSFYAELQVTTNFSFLRGASHPEEYFTQARDLGLAALGITDRNSLAGIVRAHEAAKRAGVRLVVGCRLELEDGVSVLVYPTNLSAYSRLCRLLSIGKQRAGKGACRLAWSDLTQWDDGLLAVLLPDEADVGLSGWLERLKEAFADRAYLALSHRYRPNEALRLHDLADMARAAGVPTVVTNDVLYHVEKRRILQDVVTCIREKCTIDELGFRRQRFAERHLKSPDEMAALFQLHRDALVRTREIVERCAFKLTELRYQYPTEANIPGLTAQQALEKLTFAGAAQRYPKGVPAKVKEQLREELDLIAELGYAPYFLTVRSIVAFARSKDILCQGRGSAANSAVCYVLGITSIDPDNSKLLFGRFISRDRNEPPDIDVDFDHQRREEVIQWIFETYGRDRAAIVATVITYHARGAVREVGKALGLSEDVTGALAGLAWAWSEEGIQEEHARALNLNLDDWRLQLTLQLARDLMGFPRHLSQHTGGFVLTLGRLDDLVPIEPAAMDKRQVIEWNKDDLDTVGMMKVDVLGLGMLGCMHRAFALLARHKRIDHDLASIPHEKPVYDMICKADTIGVFQIESRAQQSMLPRHRPQNHRDLTIQVAIVRPGPIQGDMVHPYLRRREGLEQPHYPTPEFREVLGDTLGVPLFQEQAMSLAIRCAGFTASEADALRRSMATFKVTGGVSHFKAKFVEGMAERGYERDFAERCFRMIEGFGSYGFPESHAASFAKIAYASSWMKCRHPDVFLCALLNSQPMGFYAPAQLVRDAIAHGVEVRWVDVNHSDWDCTLERISFDRSAVRLGLRMVRGLAEKDAERLVGARDELAFSNLETLWRKCRLKPAVLKRLAAADALRSLRLDRRNALWTIGRLRDDPLPLFAAADLRDNTLVPEIRESPIALAPMPFGAEVVSDYRHVGLTLRPHPLAFLRADLAKEGYRPASDLMMANNRDRIAIAGLVLVRQRPGSAKGVLFVTVEDELGTANLVVWPSLFEKSRRTILTASLLGCEGEVQRVGEVIHLVAHRVFDLSHLLRRVGDRDAAFAVPAGRGDEARRGGSADQRDTGVLRRRARDIYTPDIRRDTGIKLKPRDFR
jgi:error-prone DNA polymerase